MKISEKRKAGEILERGGIAQRIITIANNIANGNYKNAMEKGARIAELIDAATYDSYWSEKASKGRMDEQFEFELLILVNYCLVNIILFFIYKYCCFF